MPHTLPVPQSSHRLGHRMSRCPSGDEPARHSQDRISPSCGAGDAGLGAQTSPIHKRNEPDRAQPLQVLRRHLNLAAGTSGAEATTTPAPQARDASLLPTPAPCDGCKGVSRCTAPQNWHRQGPGGCLGHPLPPRNPQPSIQHQGCSGRGGHGALEGVREGPPRCPWGASTSCQPSGEG